MDLKYMSDLDIREALKGYAATSLLPSRCIGTVILRNGNYEDHMAYIEGKKSDERVGTTMLCSYVYDLDYITKQVIEYRNKLRKEDGAKLCMITDPFNAKTVNPIPYYYTVSWTTTSSTISYL